MIYSIPYVLLILFFGISAFYFNSAEDETSKNKITIASLVVFFIFFGFRGFIFSDWISYYPYFNNCDIDDVIHFEFGNPDYMEPGFTLLCVICHAIFDDFQFFVFVSTLIETILLYRFINKRIDNLPLALAIFLVFEGFMIVVNLMRNAISILVFLNALDFLKNRKPIPYFACCILALSFHYSAILYFPLYFFFHRGYNKWIFLGIFIACNVVFLSRISIFLKIITMLGIGGELLENKIEAYTEMGSGFGISIGYLERLMTGFLVFCYYNKLKEIREENTIFINALLAYFIAFFLFSEFSEISKRISTLFAFSYWILWIDLIKCFSIENNKKLFIGFLSIYCLMKVVGITKLPDMEYENVLLGNTSTYEQRLFIHNKTFVEPGGGSK